MNFFREIDDPKWIQEQLLQIEEEENRKQCRQIFETCMVPLERVYKDTLHQIEEQLLEREQPDKDNRIIMGITDRDSFDSTNEVLFPMISNDLDEVLIQTDSLLECLTEHGEAPLYQVYYQGNYKELLELLDRGILFPATAYTEFGVYKGLVRLQESHCYDGLLREVYDYFIRNGVTWKPVHTCFLQRIFMLQLVQLELPEPGEGIERIEIDFREYQNAFMLHPVPLWNVRKNRIYSAAYPIESPNGIFYEHLIPESKLSKQADYLVKGPCQVYDCQRSIEGDLLVRSDAGRPVLWDILELRRWKASEELPYLYRTSSEYVPKRAFHTVAEAIYCTNQLGIAALTLQHISTTRPEGFREEAVYDMNAFIEDQIPVTEQSPRLYCQWRMKDKEDPWNQDWLSYCYTCLKQVYPEYEIVCEFQ